MYVQVIDVCTSCAEHEVGLLQPQLWTLSKGPGTQTGADDLPVSYRQVRPSPDPLYRLDRLQCIT